MLLERRKVIKTHRSRLISEKNNISGTGSIIPHLKSPTLRSLTTPDVRNEPKHGSRDRPHPQPGNELFSLLCRGLHTHHFPLHSFPACAVGYQSLLFQSGTYAILTRTDINNASTSIFFNPHDNDNCVSPDARTVGRFGSVSPFSGSAQNVLSKQSTLVFLQGCSWHHKGSQ